MASGIYGVFDDTGRLVYIGRSTNTATRWSKHRVPLRGGYHPNTKLQECWNMSARELQFKMLEHGIDRLHERERLFINYCRPVANIDVLETSAGQRTRLRNFTNNPTIRKPVILADGRQFTSKTAFAEACGYAQCAAVNNALAKGHTFDMIARRRGMIVS